MPRWHILRSYHFAVEITFKHDKDQGYPFQETDKIFHQNTQNKFFIWLKVTFSWSKHILAWKIIWIFPKKQLFLKDILKAWPISLAIIINSNYFFHMNHYNIFQNNIIESLDNFDNLPDFFPKILKTSAKMAFFIFLHFSF